MRIKNSVSNEEAKRILGVPMIGTPTPRETPRIPTQLEIVPSTDEAKLNKLETAWLEVLRSRERCGQTDWIGVQNMTLKLGDDCRYTPDFSGVENGRFIFWECKGFQREDALVKMKTAARLFRWARFIKIERIKGQWIETDIKP